jgi:hypothetical protein
LKSRISPLPPTSLARVLPNYTGIHCHLQTLQRSYEQLSLLLVQGLIISIQGPISIPLLSSARCFQRSHRNLTEVVVPLNRTEVLVPLNGTEVLEPLNRTEVLVVPRIPFLE